MDLGLDCKQFMKLSMFDTLTTFILTIAIDS